MKGIQVFLLVIVLLAPVGVATFITFNDELESCELFENLSEEEEGGDDKDSENFKEKNHFRSFYTIHTIHEEFIENAINTCLEDHSIPHAVILEVQTPPPEMS